MKNKAISFRLNSTITTVTILIIAAVVYINYQFSRQVLRDKIEEGAVNQSNLVISKIARITVGTSEIARNISHQAMYYFRHQDLEMFLKQVSASNNVLEGVDIELIDPITRHPLHFSSNPETPFVFPAVELKTPVNLRGAHPESKLTVQGGWTDPFYLKNDTTHLFVSYKEPIYSPDLEVNGMVSCTVSLGRMKEMLSEIRIGERGYAFIIDQKGNLITHPRNEWILKKNLFKKSSPLVSLDIEDLESKIKRSGRGAGNGTSEFLNGQRCWFYHAALPSSNWTVFIVIPEKELFREIRYNLHKIIIVSGIAILLLFLMNMIIFKRVLDPLARIANAIQGFSAVRGREQNSRNEIKMLTESLEDWQTKYGTLLTEQSKTAREKLKFEKDLKSAHDIQQNIIPSGYPAFPDHPEIDLFAVLKPAESIGGDLYDYYFIDNEHLLIAIGDVSGKGIPASLFMAIASTLIKSNSKICASREIIEKVNNELGERNPNQYFLTLFIGILNVNTGILDYCNAAHNYPYVLHMDGTLQTMSKSHGIPLGIYKNKTYKSNTIQLIEGDLVLLYTDGIINSRNSEGVHLGADYLRSKVQEMNNLNAREIVTRLLESVDTHKGETVQADDITLVALKYQSIRDQAEMLGRQKLLEDEKMRK